MERIIDGSYTLKQTQSAVLFQEAGGYELLSLRKGSANGMLTEDDKDDRPVNHATFRETEPVGLVPKDVKFIAISVEKSLPELITDQMTNGWVVMFVAPVFMKGKEAQVAAFRKQ